jgi:hypothetical protein
MAHPLTVMLPLDPSKNVAELLTKVAANQDALNGALAGIGTVHYARFILFDRSKADLRPTLSPEGLGEGPFAFGIITEFDGDFDVYTEEFVNEIGFLFDLGLSFTIDGQSLIPVQEHLTEFAAYLKEHNLSEHPPNQGLFNAYPFTVKEILAQMQAPKEY